MTACMDLLYPKNCHICSKILNSQTRAYDDYICWDCFWVMKKTPVVACSLCGSLLKDDKELNTLKCRACQQDSPPYQRLLACYIYEGTTRELIHRFKYGNRPYLSKTIIRLMTDMLNPIYLREVDCLVPVPLHPVRQREREYNQAELITEGLSRQFNKPFSLALRRIKNTESQVSLAKKERFLNLKGAFALAHPSFIEDKNVLVIDDVVTTTATANEASRILKDAGAKSISVLAFAKG